MLLLSWNVHIHHQSTQGPVHCPSSPDDLEWKMYKAEKMKKNAHKYERRRDANIHTSAHIDIPKDSKHTHREIFYETTFMSSDRFESEKGKATEWCFLFVCCSALSYPYQRLNQIYEPVMKHFTLIVFVYEQINGSRAKRMMMWAHTQHERIPEEFISCLQVIRGNN